MDAAKMFLGISAILFGAAAVLFGLSLSKFRRAYEMRSYGFRDGMQCAARILNNWATERRKGNRPDGHVSAHMADTMATVILTELERRQPTRPEAR